RGRHAASGTMAAVTLKARDTQDLKIAFQMPIYPMIDDSQSNPSAQNVGTPLWDAKTNAMGWGAYLKGLHEQGIEIPAYAAPIRNTDYRNFPPTLTFVGSMDPFRDETLAYVDALKKAQIPLAFELFEGGYHGFEVVKAKSSIGQAAWKFFLDNYARFYDAYCVGKVQPA
ncbi:MAG: alpha/beta hydrolase fold domain-containing protein, partial [Bacteroidota bacterium]